MPGMSMDTPHVRYQLTFTDADNDFQPVAVTWRTQVPAAGDYVQFNRSAWRVLYRAWPIPDEDEPPLTVQVIVTSRDE